MTDDRPICELFSVMVDWMQSIGVTDASKGEQPWRGQLETPSGGIIKVALNASKDPVKDGAITLDPYHAALTSDDVMALAVFNPFGGACGGVDETYFINMFKHAMKVAT